MQTPIEKRAWTGVFQNPKLQAGLSCVLILLGSILGIHAQIHDLFALPAHATLLVNTIECPAIVGGLKQVHTLAETTAWLHGPWAGQNQFFRPVSSLVWWTVYQAFGNDLRVFQWLHYGLHLAFVVTGFFFLEAVTKRAVAAAGSVIFALGLQTWLGTAAPAPALGWWFDNVEPLWGIFYLLCLLAYRRFLQSKSRIGYAVALLLMVITIGCKETGLTLPAALFGLLCFENLRREMKTGDRWQTLLPFAVLSVALFLYRAILFHGRGAHYGSNGSAATRGLIALGGDPAARLLERDIMPLAIALAALGLYFFLSGAGRGLSFHRAGMLLLCLAGAFCLILWRAHDTDWSPLTTLATIFTPGVGEWITPDWKQAAQLLLMLALFRSLLRRTNRRAKLFFMGLFALTIAPALTAQVTDHVQYVPSYFYAAAMGIVSLEWASLFRVSPFRTRRKPNKLVWAE